MKSLHRFFYVLFITTSLIFCFSAEIIKVPAMGRVGDLGSLYNGVTEQIVHGHYAYSNHTFPSHLIDQKSIGYIMAKGSVVHNYFEANTATGISSSVALSIYAGLVNPSGSTRVHKDFTVKKDKIYAVLSYDFRSFKETLNVRHKDVIALFDAESITFYDASHVITGIEWGAAVNCGYEIETFGVTDKTQVEADLNIELSTVANRLQTRREYSMSNSSSLGGVNMNIELFTDVELGTMAVTSMKEMWELVVTVPNITKFTYTGKGSQMYYILTEVQDLYHFANISTPANLTALPQREFESQLTLYARQEFLNNREIIVLHSHIKNTIMKYPLLEPKNSKDIDVMRTNHDALYHDEFLPALKNLTFQVRRYPKANHSAYFLTMSSWYESKTCGGKRALDFMKLTSANMNAKIEFFRTLLGKGVHYLGPSQSLTVLSLEHQEGDLYVLFVPEKNQISEGNPVEPYECWGEYFLFLTKARGARFVADCSIRTLSTCKGLEKPKIFHYNQGFLLSDNFVPFTVGKTKQGKLKLLDAIKKTDVLEDFPTLFGKR